MTLFLTLSLNDDLGIRNELARKSYHITSQYLTDFFIKIYEYLFLSALVRIFRFSLNSVFILGGYILWPV